MSLSASLRVMRGNNTFGRTIDFPLKNLEENYFYSKEVVKDQSQISIEK